MSEEYVSHPAFGESSFGEIAERAARLFGTPQYIVGQTLAVIVWIALNSIAVVRHWDPYPFILLNLAFSTQAAYAAPLILLAQTRQADRDKAALVIDQRRHEHQAEQAAKHVAAIKSETNSLRALLQSNTDLTERDTKLTEEVARLTREIHRLLSDGRRPT
jgi:uncharacterized membrane protein